MHCAMSPFVDGLRLHRVKHLSVVVKPCNDIFSLRMISRDDDGNVLFRFRLLSLDLCRFKIIAFLLACFIKPIREKSCTLSLLLTFCAAHIKQNVRIRTKELINHAKNCLHNFDIMMRCDLVKICKAKPIGIKNRVFHYLKIYRVSTPIVCFEIKNLPFISDFIRRENID